MRHVEPTGRWRHRTDRNWLGRERLVLQIEERGIHTSYIGTEWVTRWRDARTEDLSLHAAAKDLVALVPDLGEAAA